MNVGRQRTRTCTRTPLTDAHSHKHTRTPIHTSTHSHTQARTQILAHYTHELRWRVIIESVTCTVKGINCKKKSESRCDSGCVCGGGMLGHRYCTQILHAGVAAAATTATPSFFKSHCHLIKNIRPGNCRWVW